MAKTAAKGAALRTPDARVSALGIAREVARDIERGKYAPGARLREQELADRFHCSRAPVREALRILESQGIVVIAPMRGASVASVDDASFYEVFLIRKALAGVMAQEAAKAVPSAAKTAFLNEARALRQAATRAETAPEFGAAVRVTIRALIELARKPRIVQLVRSLTFGYEAFQDEVAETKAARRTQALNWTRLAHAVEAADPAEARAAMEAIFDFAFDSITKKHRALKRAPSE